MTDICSVWAGVFITGRGQRTAQHFTFPFAHVNTFTQRHLAVVLWKRLLFPLLEILRLHSRLILLFRDCLHNFKDPDRTVLGFYKEIGHDFSCGESFAKRVDDFIIHSIFAACFVFLEQFAEPWTSIGTANDPTDLTFSVDQERFLTNISTMAEAPVLAWSLR